MEDKLWNGLPTTPLYNLPGSLHIQNLDQDLVQSRGRRSLGYLSPGHGLMSQGSWCKVTTELGAFPLLLQCPEHTSNIDSHYWTLNFFRSHVSILAFTFSELKPLLEKLNLACTFTVFRYQVPVCRHYQIWPVKIFHISINNTDNETLWPLYVHSSGQWHADFLLLLAWELANHFVSQLYPFHTLLLCATSYNYMLPLLS
jgi:hypothetical protein